MTDRKFDYIQKKTQHVLTDSKGEIIWFIGERTSEKTKITETTKKILRSSSNEKENIIYHKFSFHSAGCRQHMELLLPEPIK